MKVLILSSFLVCLCNYGFSLNLPGPAVYVVTPSSKPRIDEARSAPQPFYYRNWMKRMDTPQNSTTTTTTTTPPVKTPDLIFAEFESDHMKNIRKLLEKERIAPKTSTTTTTTTLKPIYVPEDTDQEAAKYGLPVSVPKKDEMITKEKDMTDYFALYNNMYNSDNAPPAPVYLPSTTSLSPKLAIPTSTSSSTTPAPVNNVENIWHIIDNEKHDQYTGQWDEIPISADNGKVEEKNNSEEANNEEKNNDDEATFDQNFAIPGFSTNPGNGGENESRAIRTEPNMRFPYVNLKPFQVKNPKKPLFDGYSNNKKGNNMYTNLDNFVEVKNPVRGEAQDVVPMRQPIDRYNPAQPYLPGPAVYGSKSKQSSPSSSPVKAISNLVPPPPPPPPKVTDNDFPAPNAYEQFPPFAPGPDSAPPSPPMKPFALPPPMDSSDSGQGDDSDAPVMDLGYRYKPPSAPTQNFLPTLPPLQKPFKGYSYDKPVITAEAPPTDDGNDFQGYSYDKPSPEMHDKPNYGYHYSKPEAPAAPPPKYHGPSYDHAPSYGPTHDHHHDSDYPELIFDKPHGGAGGMKGGDDMKGDDMGMVPPPMPDNAPAPPMDDSGFPHDFPDDFKYHHDFDHDHDFYHHHHHHTTTTTTTETPRVNRYSYYYLGKKLYYIPLYFSAYFIIYVGALIIKAVLRHKIVYPNSWRPNDTTSSFFSKRSVDSWDLPSENLHEMAGRVTHAIATAAERYRNNEKEKKP